MTARFIIGDTLTVLRSMPAASVDLVLTSPPFLALRSYLPADHPDKRHEMGSEATPGEFIDAPLTVVEECRRVVAPHGSICFELGDTYSGSGGGGGDYNAGGFRNGQERFDGSASRDRWDNKARGKQFGRNGTGGDGWPLDKSLCLIPELFRVALVYGFNPLTGRQTPRWRARNVVRWCRPNPPVGALGDKVRPATSDMVIACVDRRRYFDLDAVRTPTLGPPRVTRVGQASASKGISGGDSGNPDKERLTHNPSGAPPLDHWWHDDTFGQDAWLISTEPYRGSHYATWPTDLLVKPIEAMCPHKVCTTCGRPSERIVDAGYLNDPDDSTRIKKRPQLNGKGVDHPPEIGWERSRETVGWSDCGHDSWRPGVVLDIFAGSGTTLAVATGHGRDAIGIDLDERNADLARERVGMFLEVEQHEARVA